MNDDSDLNESLIDSAPSVLRIDRPKRIRRVGDGVVFQAQQRRQFLLIQFIHPLAHVLGEHEIDKTALLVINIMRQCVPGVIGARRARQRRPRPGHVGEHIEQIAVFGLDEFLHLRQRLAAEALLGQSIQQCLTRRRIAPEFTQVRFVAEEVRQHPEQALKELCGGHWLAVRAPERRRDHALDLSFLAIRQLHPDPGRARFGGIGYDRWSLSIRRPG